MTVDPAFTDAVAVLNQWEAPDPEQDRLRHDYLALLAQRSDATRRDCWPQHLTASAVVLDPSLRRVALVLHAKVQLWLQPGGHIEDGDLTLGSAAIREAEEELGLSDLSLLADRPASLHRHAAPCRPGVVPGGHHLDVSYVLIAGSETSVAVSAESHDVGWFDVDRLPDPSPPDLRWRVDRATAMAAV